MYPLKIVYVKDSSVTNYTDADAAAELYYNRYGKVIPGTFSFTTTDLDYRPGHKISVDIDRLGMTAAKTMNIDSVTIYDADGVNLLANVVCSNRDSTTYAAAPNTGSSAYMSDLSTKVNTSVTAINQQAGTFTPALAGAATAGTWTWTTQTGYYIKHGNICYVSIRLAAATKADSPDGALTLTGLPFTSAADQEQILQVMSDGMDWNAGRTQLHAYIAGSATTATFRACYTDAFWTVIDVDNILVGDVLIIHGWYQITP
jgi:hypothetical protein